MQFIFVHGKNPGLSLAEIMAVAGKRPLEACAEFSLFDIYEASDLMERLGGTLKIAEVLSILDIDSGKEAVENSVTKHFHEFMRGVTGNRLIFGISFYNGAGDMDIIGKKIKQLGRAEGMKVSAAHAKGSCLSHTDIITKKVLENGFEIILCAGRQHLYVAKTVAVHNPFEFRKRDLKRPVQKPIYSIPPRLARILINLAGARKGGTVMDPFCGIGTILSEAALMGMHVIGVDTKDSCIGDTRKNLKWLEKEYKIRIPEIENSVRREDARWLSSHFRRGSVDAIATEPYMGPPLKSRPDRLHAMRILDGLRQLYEHSLREMIAVLKPGGRVCVVSPSFIVKGKFYGLNMAGIAGRCGGRLIDPLAGSDFPHSKPLRDFEEHHNTLREINVIEKRAD